MSAASIPISFRTRASAKHHLVVLRPHYLRLICSGTKRIECRLSRSRIPPYGCVGPGDVLWLKRSSGPVCAVAQVERIWQFGSHVPLNLEWIRSIHADQVQADPDFWNKSGSARFGVLIWLGAVQTFQPFRITKNDRRGWVVLPKPLLPGFRIRGKRTSFF